MSKRLLLADDSITIQRVVELMLSDEGFEVRSVNNGDEALAAVKDFVPDVILADIEMPGINGYQLCEAIKGDDEMKKIPVILLAGAFEPIDMERTREVNADGYLIKPFESQELTAKIYSLFHGKVSTGDIYGGGVQEEPEEVISQVSGVRVTGQAVRDKDVDVEGHPSVEDGFQHGGMIMPETAFVKEVIEKSIPLREDTERMLRDILRERASALVDSIDRDSLYIDILDAIEKGVDKRLNELDLREIVTGKVEISADERMIKEVIEERFSALIGSIDIPGLNRLIEETMERTLTGILSSLNLPDIVQGTVQTVIGHELDGILRETVPVAVERAVTAAVEASLSQLRDRTEKVVWETIPGLAEAIINREIERIKSAL